MPNPFYKNNTWTQEADSGDWGNEKGGYKYYWSGKGNTPDIVYPSGNNPYGIYKPGGGGGGSRPLNNDPSKTIEPWNPGKYYGPSKEYDPTTEPTKDEDPYYPPGGGGGGGGLGYNPIIAPAPGVSPAIEPYNIEQPDYVNPYLNFTNPWSNYTNPWQQILDNAKDPGYANTYGALRDEFKNRQEAEYNTRVDAIAKRLNATNEAYDAQQEFAKQEAQNNINANEVQKFRTLRNLDESQANRGIRNSGQAKQENLMANAKYDTNNASIKNNLQTVINGILNNKNQASADAEAEKYNARNAMDSAITEYNTSNMAEERQMQNQYQQYLQDLANYALDYDTKMKQNEAQYDADYRTRAEQYDINDDERNKDLQLALEKLRLQAQAEQDQRDKDYQHQLALMNLKYGYYK